MHKPGGVPWVNNHPSHQCLFKQVHLAVTPLTYPETWLEAMLCTPQSSAWQKAPQTASLQKSPSVLQQKAPPIHTRAARSGNG